MQLPVSTPKNLYYDSESISSSTLTLEQNYNDTNFSSIRQNHFGSGILPISLTSNILFNSANVNGLMDGKPITTFQNQPSDSSLGNFLSISLSNSLCAGNRSVKVFLIGLNFQNILQYESLTFYTNETQITSRHYTKLLLLMTNDFVSTNITQSLNLGGRIVIAEAGQIELSRDPLSSISQTYQPNIFFRDFFVASGTLQTTLTAALPSYNINTLNITIGASNTRIIAANGVTTTIAQKFIATSNNIEKITLLLSVQNLSVPSNLVWTGDLLISLYPLQSVVSCQSDIVPSAAIDFDPSNIPLVQLSFNYSQLLAAGIQLNTVPQPVDFVFSNTAVGSGFQIKQNSYYAIAVKRAGVADTCQIQFSTGVNSNPNTRETIFSGSVWTDIPEESLWFQVWVDAAKVSDGTAYDNGITTSILKTQISSTTGLTEDYVLDDISFVRNDLWYALLQATTEDIVPVEDDRTGNQIFSQQQFVPNLQLLNTAGLANIQNVIDPLIIGTISDQNVKSFNASNSTISAEFHEYGMVGNQIVIKVITDTTDGYRFDENIIELVSELVNGNLNSAQLIPNTSNPSLFYRIAKAELITSNYGDVNGDGVVDINDLLLAQNLLNANLNVIPTYQQYISNTSPFKSDGYCVFNIINPTNFAIIESGTDGILTVNPLNGSLANFHSISANFNAVVNLGTYQLQIVSSTFPVNVGSFVIESLIDNSNITIEKIIYTSETILQIMRADVNTNMVVDTNDIGFIQNYINAVQPFPPPTPPANRIGTPFTAIRLSLEKFVDRNDDYPSTGNNRATTIHPLPDIFLDGYSSFAGQNLEFDPLSFNIVEQLVWEASSIVISTRRRFVPVAFEYQSGLTINKCGVVGEVSNSFPQAATFDPGRNDFFIPNNLVIDYNGQIIRPDGYSMKMDIEIGTIIIEIPTVNFDGYTINLLTDFIGDYTNTGYTRLGYPSMRFSDCSTVPLTALINNQIRFSVGVQSFSPLLNGIDNNCISGVIVDDKIGVSFDYGTGLLTLNFSNLFQDIVNQTLNTKLEIVCYLKKAGFVNNTIFVPSTRMQNILNIPTPPILPDC